MKRWLLWLVTAAVLAGAGTWFYNQYFSESAQVRAAGKAFMRAAVAGDEAGIGESLAPDSPLKVADILRLYKGHTYNNFYVYPLKALPNGSGVTWVANTSTIDPSSPNGSTHGTTLAFKQVDGKWLVYQAGAAFALDPR